jgi:hypothetical protein
MPKAQARRPFRHAAIIAALSVLAGCVQQTGGSPGGDANAGIGPGGADLSGNYGGTATNDGNPGGACKVVEPVSNFRVNGNRATFGQYRGTIQPDGSVEMVFGRSWIVGRFSGPHFEGRTVAGPTVVPTPWFSIGRAHRLAAQTVWATLEVRPWRSAIRFIQNSRPEMFLSPQPQRPPDNSTPSLI